MVIRGSYRVVSSEKKAPNSEKICFLFEALPLPSGVSISKLSFM